MTCNTLPQCVILSEPEHRQRIKRTRTHAEKYLHRNPKKHAAEMELIERGFAALPRQPRTVLDAPCGVGRAAIFLAKKGYDSTGIDLGDAAVEIAREQVRREGLQLAIDHGDLLALPYDDGQFDAVLCFRLLHHLPTAEYRGEIINALCRISNDFILISYLSPYSFTSVKRRIHHRLTGKKIVQNTTALSEIKEHFAANGFAFVQNFIQGSTGPVQKIVRGGVPFVHSLNLAVFSKK